MASLRESCPVVVVEAGARVAGGRTLHQVGPSGGRSITVRLTQQISRAAIHSRILDEFIGTPASALSGRMVPSPLWLHNREAAKSGFGDTEVTSRKADMAAPRSIPDNGR